jgi:hypothetical protein
MQRKWWPASEEINTVTIVCAYQTDEGARLLLDYHRYEWSTSRARARVDRHD